MKFRILAYLFFFVGIADLFIKIFYGNIFSDLTEDEQEAKINHYALAIERKKLDEEKLELEASSLIAHGGYILDKVKAAHDFNRRITESSS